MSHRAKCVTSSHLRRQRMPTSGGSSTLCRPPPRRRRAPRVMCAPNASTATSRARPLGHPGTIRRASCSGILPPLTTERPSALTATTRRSSVRAVTCRRVLQGEQVVRPTTTTARRRFFQDTHRWRVRIWRAVSLATSSATACAATRGSTRTAPVSTPKRCGKRTPKCARCVTGPMCQIRTEVSLVKNGDLKEPWWVV